VAIAMLYNLKAVRHCASRYWLSLAKFVLRTRRNCYFQTSGQHADIPL